MILATMTTVAQDEKKSHFAWGLDLASSIDMTGNAMTSIDISGYFGYKNDFFRIVGIGGEIDAMMSNSSRSIPVFAIIRTSFQKGRRLLFADFRGGISMNNVYDYNTQTGAYGSVGIGITLAQGKTFSSHMIVGYSYISRSDFDHDDGVYHCPDLHQAVVRIGISF